MSTRDKDLEKLARMLTKVGDHLVEKHSVVLGRIKGRKNQRNGRRKRAVSETIKEVSGKLAAIGDKLSQKTNEGKTKGFRFVRTLTLARREFRQAVENVIRRLLTKDS